MSRGGDAAISDVAGTLLMIGAVVLAGGALAAVVSANLAETGAPAVSIGLGGAAAGDTSARLLYRNGESLDLAGIRVSLQRGGGTLEDVPRATWTTPSASQWRAGETLSFPLSPAAAPGETLRVRVVLQSVNAAIADASTQVPDPSTISTFAAPTLVANVSPGTLFADGASTARVSVRVSHPAGALAVARMMLDLRNLSAAGGSAGESMPMSDTGINGDTIGGDGIWSVLVRASSNTTPGTYNLTINATDLAGRLAGSTWVNLNVSGNLSHLVTNATNAIGNITGNFSGTCIGCTIVGGSVAYEGTRINAPSSQNVTSFKLENWTYDRGNPNRLASDTLLLRVLGNSYAWSIHFAMDYGRTAQGQPDIPSIIRVTTYNTNQTTVWLPTAANRVGIEGLTLDVLNLTDLFTCSTGCSPAMTYQNADIRAPAGLLVAWLRDESNNFATDELGLYAVDMVIT